jgi:hypothetical protein
VIFSRGSDLSGGKSQGPSRIFLFLDEREDCGNWGNYMQDMTGYGPPAVPSAYLFGDMPGNYHNMGCAISFTDGHADFHKWYQYPATLPVEHETLLFDGSTPMPAPNSRDVAYMQSIATCLR